MVAMKQYRISLVSPQVCDADDTTIIIHANNPTDAMVQARAIVKEIRSAPGDVDDYQIDNCEEITKPSTT